ncbi:MAG: hypothetical protein M1819_002233 [Sarea resinae]|nr:MAG: hypothetical protein M1819_002233 [Sarea resinae]
MASEKADHPQPNGHPAGKEPADGPAAESSEKNGKDGKQGASKLKTLKKPELPKKDKPPAGGFDDTPVPSAPPGYTIKFTFHRASNLPMADINSLSSDPFVLAQINTSLPTRHKEDPHLRFRMPTKRRTTNPEWEESWIVANIPADGFKLKARIYDEDPADHDDRLGNVHVHVDNISESWPGIHDEAFQIKKRSGSKRAYFIRGCAALFTKGLHMSGDLILSAEVLGRTEGEGGRAYTVGPCNWTKHFSPLLGRMGGIKSPSDGKGGVESYNFQANQFQLQGPVPAKLYHRYVEFKPFVAGMFTTKGLRGRILHGALHHQHARVYNYDRTTVYGSFPSPSTEMSQKFLDLVHYDQGGRIFTYVLTLDAQLRFTETGKEFGVDLLSKHTMHSDVSIYIAFSGEFFIRRLRHKDRSPSDPTNASHPPEDIPDGPPADEPPRDPSDYELIIDNDSGTYRPNAALLPDLRAFLSRNLPGLKIVTLDCNGDKDRMDKLKQEQRDLKKKEGDQRLFVQGDRGSLSSSDEEELAALEAGGERKEKGVFEQGISTAMEDQKRRVQRWKEGDHLPDGFLGHNSGGGPGNGEGAAGNGAGSSSATGGN